MVPNVLLAYHSRPMCAGLMFREGFRQAGCQVSVLGPSTGHVYGTSTGVEHVFDADDYVVSDYEVPNEPQNISSILNYIEEQEFDLVVAIDQYDPFRLFGSTGKIPFAYVCVENWGRYYVDRVPADADFVFYMINHSQEVDFPRDDYEWMPFGFDPQIHKYVPIWRDKTVIQIGSAYEPRPAIWNAHRAALDNEAPLPDNAYRDGWHETASTIFGRIPSYRKMVEAHNRAKVALSSSNVDFSPMRTCEAYGMGCVLVSDDVPAIRGVLGAPLSEGGFWVAHDRTAEGTVRATQEAAEAYENIIDRGIAHVYKYHTYRARCERILEKAGLSGACRII